MPNANTTNLLQRAPVWAVRALALLAIAALCACGDGDDDFDALEANYAGAWDLRYNLVQDECGITEEGVFGFTAGHLIDQQGQDVLLQTDTGGFADQPFQGTVRDDGSFLVEQIVEGDIFGDGDSCSHYQAISYEATSEDVASSQFVRRINCASGYVCESTAIGESKRLPA